MNAVTSRASTRPGQGDVPEPRPAAAHTPQPQNTTMRPAAVKPQPSEMLRRDAFLTFCHETVAGRTGRRGAEAGTGGSSAVGSRSGADGTGTDARPYSGCGSVGSPHGSAGGYM